MRRAARAAALFALSALLGAAGRPAAAGPETPGTPRAAEPRVVSVSPAIRGDDLVCDVETRGLPTEEAARSMRGGLPSGVEIVVDLVGGTDETIVRRRVFFRLSYDLWEEVFRAEEGGSERRFDTLGSLRSFLETMNGLPVAPLAGLSNDARYRIRVDLVPHAIAPAERARIADWIAGEGGSEGRGASGTARDADEREVSFGLGSLIRFFYGGANEESSARAAGESDWFRIEEIGHAAHSR